jgi:hypothetical protein
MIRWFLRRQIAAFERRWNYDAVYIREVIDADPRAFVVFSKVIGIGNYRKGVPIAAHYAAKVAPVMAEDCGPCTQLAVDMAQRTVARQPLLRWRGPSAAVTSLQSPNPVPWRM